MQSLAVIITMVDANDNSRSTDSNGLKPQDARVLHDLCDQFEAQLRGGQAVRCENVFAMHPWLLTNAEVAMDLVYTEYVTRREVGQLPSQDEYFARFPDWREQLKHQFELDALLVDSPTMFEESVPVEPPPETVSNRVIVRYQVIEALARGGIGEIKRALDTEVKREVAIKSVLPAHYANQPVMARFLREAEITGRLEHPGIVPVYGMGLDGDGIPFYAMRLIHGQNFQDAIIEMHRRVPIRERFLSKEFLNLLRRFLSICETIAYAHSRGVIHRDIKPQNIMLGPYGETLVVDWGLAKQLDNKDEDPADESPNDTAIDDPSPMETRPGRSLIGTPAFMSPEQAAGRSQEVGPHSDVYSLGATLFMLLTGSSRFDGSDIENTLQCVVEGQFPKPREIISSIPRGLEAICVKALSRIPKDRYHSASDLSSDIEHWLADETISASKESLIGLAARFERRNRGAVMAATVGLLIVSIVATAAALRINQERLRADRQRIETLRQGARLAFDRGYSFVNEHEAGTGVLWFEQALRLAPNDETGLRRVILTNMASASRDILVRTRDIPLRQTDVLTQFSTSGKQLLNSNLSGFHSVIDTKNFEVIWKQQLPGFKLLAAAFKTDDRPLLAFADGESVIVHSVDIRNLREPFGLKTELPTGSVDRAVISDDQRWMATAGQVQGKHQVRVWDLSSKESVWASDFTNSVVELRFLANNRQLIVIEAGRRAIVFDLQDSQAENWLQDAAIRRVAVSTSGNKLFTDTRHGSIAVWDLESKRQIYEFQRFPGSISSLACSTDGAIVAAAWDSGFARLWLVDERRPASEVLRADRFVSDLVFSPNTRQLLVRQSKQYLSVWEVPNPDQFVPQIDQRGINAIAFNHEGSLVATSSSNGSVQVRDVQTGSLIGKTIKHKSEVRFLAFSPDSNALLTASQDSTARKWNAKTGSPLGKSMQHRNSINRAVKVASASLIPATNQLVTGDRSGTIRIWDIKNSELTQTIPSVANFLISMRCSPDGQSVVAGYGPPDNGVRLWSTTTGELIWSTADDPQSHTDAVRVVAFSPDSRYVLSGSNDGTAKLWNAKTGQLEGGPMQHRGQLFAVNFSPDGRLAVTAGYDATVRLWHVPEGTAYGSLMQHDALVLDAVFDPSGQRLLSGSVDKTARLWDVQTCLPFAKPLVHSGTVSSVGFSPDSQMAVTGRIWKLPKPLPDDTELIRRWVRLATQRTLADGNRVEWIDHAVLIEESDKFRTLTGQPWQTWGQ
jgi:eukaryotic-like serine/threonine-protein kinase